MDSFEGCICRGRVCEFCRWGLDGVGRQEGCQRDDAGSMFRSWGSAGATIGVWLVISAWLAFPLVALLLEIAN